MLRTITGRVTGFTRNLVKFHLEWIYRVTRTRTLLVVSCALLLLVLSLITIRSFSTEISGWKRISGKS